jgi:MYXO-CTERM domain-containing protein
LIAVPRSVSPSPARGSAQGTNVPPAPEGLQIAPAAYGCELPFLTAGREVVIVGFGQTETNSVGTKMAAVTTIQRIGESARIGGAGTSSCQGDSGGPAYVRLGADEGGDDTWRGFGIVSGDSACGSPTTYALIHRAIPWIEEHSGVDVTPCYDVEGNWEPGPDCGGHPTGSLFAGLGLLALVATRRRRSVAHG